MAGHTAPRCTRRQALESVFASALEHTAGPGLVSAGARKELELLGPVDRRPTGVHAELAVDVLGVGMQRVQGHDELAGDRRTVQVGAEQSQHVELSTAQWLD